MAKDFNVKDAYAEYASGKKTINDIADESGLTSLEVATAFDNVNTKSKDK